MTQLKDVEITNPSVEEFIAGTVGEEFIVGKIGNGLAYPNRCRFSQAESPLDIAELLQSYPGRVGDIDAPTLESIINVEFVEDRLIVFFKESTWEIVYTGNQVCPFSWEKTNTDFHKD